MENFSRDDLSSRIQFSTEACVSQEESLSYERVFQTKNVSHKISCKMMYLKLILSYAVSLEISPKQHSTQNFTNF